MKKLFLSLVLLANITLSQAMPMEPMYITFDEMMDTCSLIVVAEYIGPTHKNTDFATEYKLLVKKTLLGKVTSDTITVGRAHGSVFLEPGKIVVAFINQNNEFEWVGVPHGGISPEKSFIQIEGFYDWNAYLVSPSIVTFDQLIQYINEEKFTGTVNGKLHFFSPKTNRMEPGKVSFHVNYTYQNGALSHSVSVTGADLSKFGSTPQNVFLPVWDKTIHLEYESNLVRPLEIAGEIVSISTDSNHFEAVYWVESPIELTYKEFSTFIKNEKLGYPYFELELTTAEKDQCTILLDEEIGRIGRILNCRGKEMPCKRISGAPNREIEFRSGNTKLILYMDSTNVSDTGMQYYGDRLVRELRNGPINCTLVYSENGEEKARGRGKLAYKKTGWMPNVNYGK